MTTARTEEEETREMSRPFTTALAVCALASVVPLFCARHLPMSDLPEHVAAIATIRHYWDPAWRSGEYFTLTGIAQTPYWLYHAVGALLSVVLGSAERANLVVLVAVGVAYPYSLRALLVALRRDPRLALFGCALFWTNNLTTGLLSFVASVPVVLYGLALVARQVERPSRRRSVGLAALSLSLLYLHGVSFLFFVLQAAILVVLVEVPDPAAVTSALVDRARSAPRRMVWLVPSAIAGASILAHGHALASDQGGTHVETRPWLEKLTQIPSWLFDSFHTKADDVLGWLLFGALVASVLLSRSRAAMSFAERWRSNVTLALFASAFLVYLLTPARAGAYAFLLDVRCIVFVAMFAAMVPSPRHDLRGALPLAATAALALGLSIDAGVQVRAFERDEVGHFDELLRQMPRGSRLAQLNFDPRSSIVNANPFGYFGSYYRARYGGIASFSFSEMPHWPVRYRAEWEPPTKFVWGNPCLFKNSRDGAYYDFVLTHGDVDPFAARPPGPEWERIGGTRAFRLYRKLPSFSASEGDDAGPCRPRM